MMNRRRFLRGLGGITVALPMLSAFGGRTSAQPAAAHPTRMVVMAYPMGTYVPGWAPSAQGSSFTLGTVTSPLEAMQSRCLFLSNFDNSIHELVTSHQFGHPGKERTTLTGTLTLDALRAGRNHVDAVDSGGGADGGAGGPSIEEVVGRYLRRPIHRDLGVGLAINGEPSRRLTNVDSEFFHEAAGTPVTLQADLGRAFADLFGSLDGDPIDPAMQHLRERNQSVLDAVRGSFTELRSGLGAADRLVLDEHAARIRNLEIDVMRAMCMAPDGVGPMSTGATMSEVAPLQNRIAAAALGCDLAPVARLEYIEQQNPAFGIPSVESHVRGFVDWHDVVHQTDDSAEGRVAGFRFFVQMYAHLLDELASIPDGSSGATLLDNTLVLLATNFGPGNGHSARKMCMLLAGNLGGARRGFHFDARTSEGFYGSTSHNVNHIHNSILRMVGVTDASGAPVTTHGLSGFADGQVVEEIFR